MLPEHRNLLKSALPDELPYPWFKGREAAWLLYQRAPANARLAALRKSEISGMLERPVLAPVIGACGDGVLPRDQLLPLADPDKAFSTGSKLIEGRVATAAFEALCAQDVRPFTVSFADWGSAGPRAVWRELQQSRPGGNLVLQVNFPDAYVNRFNRTFSQALRQRIEFYGHPVRQDWPITMAWARLDFDPAGDEVLIEEIQTDWLRQVARSRPDFVFDVGRKNKETAHAFVDETIHRYGSDWAEATLFAAIAFARSELGARNVWLHQHHAGARLKNIRTFLPPRSLYQSLPKRLGFRATDRAPDLLYRARSQVLHRLRRRKQPVFWHLNLEPGAVSNSVDAAPFHEAFAKSR